MSETAPKINKFAAYQAFVQVVECGGFTAAARRLGLSASSVTKTISRLEEDLGVRLFNRTTRKFALTEHGQSLFDRAQKILADVDEAESLLSEATSSPQGTVRIVTPFLFGRLTLIPALPRFLNQYPQLRLHVHFSDRPVDLIESGFDCGVHTGELADSGLIRRQLTRGPLITAAAPSYLSRRGEPTTPASLENHNCLHGRFGPDWLFRKPDGGTERIKVNGNLAVFNGDALRESAVMGLGIVQQSWWALQHELKSGRLRQVLKDFEADGPAVAVVYPATRHLPARVRVVIDFLVDITSAKPRAGKAYPAR